jgi:hypothetical protein
MTVLVIGSHALNNLNVSNRSPKDYDLFSPDEYSAHVADVFWHPSFEAWLSHNGIRYATLDELYTIKMSHSHWDLANGSWSKHIADIISMKAMGAKVDEDLYKLLYKVWEEKHGKKVMNLDQDKTEFFDDAVRRMYDHDSLHESVAYGERPIYEDILKDGATVDVDSHKLWALPHERIVQLFTEEICVTALERIVIPKNYRVSPGRAYTWALRRTVTSLTKGKSSRFILNNIEEFIKPDPEYVKRHLAKADKLVKL